MQCLKHLDECVEDCPDLRPVLGIVRSHCRGAQQHPALSRSGGATLQAVASVSADLSSVSGLITVPEASSPALLAQIVGRNEEHGLLGCAGGQVRSTCGCILTPISAKYHNIREREERD